MDEAIRIEVLLSLDILNTPSEVNLDDILVQVQKSFETPTVILSLMDSDKHRFKSVIGTVSELKEIPRAGSLFSEPAEGEEPYVTDIYPSSEPDVSSAAGDIRFYAGCPIIVFGARIGTLSILDTVSRTFSAEQRQSLKSLARWIQMELQSQSVSKRAEESMMVKELYEALLHESSLGVALFSIDGIFQEGNALAKDLLDLPATSPPDLSREDAFGTDHVSKAFQKCLVGQAYYIEPFEYRGTSSRALLQIVLKPLRINSRTFKVMVTIEDVTVAAEVARNQKRLIKEAVQAKEKAILERQERETFMSVLAHEMRNPLNGIFSITELLIDNPRSVTPENLHNLKTCSRMLSSLIDNTLDLERIDQGRLKLDIQTFNLEELITTEVELRRAKAVEQNISLSYKMTKDIGYVSGDELRIRQILGNLLTNAIKHSPNGFVQVECYLQDEHHVFKVTDTGVGISQKDIATIFEPYFQVSRKASESKAGIGLGLSIVKGLVSLMGGTMGAESISGKGSTFWIALSLSKAYLSLSHKESLQRISGRVLVVEDNAINRRIMELQLISYGISVSLAGNGQEALSLLEEQEFDIIFMDCHMPIMDGYEATRQIRANAERYGTPKIIALTASSAEKIKHRCLNIGMDDFLRKPVRNLQKRLSAYLADVQPEMVPIQ